MYHLRVGSGPRHTGFALCRQNSWSCRIVAVDRLRTVWGAS
ncbi:hypothetical protein MSMEI_3414 [Mycolicibacterium smegmatis MC2 155]|uniref:Uncharacterized protein n=1 Tax=Mycolicibacterium smegmatis (strain ATCC 700084 / mc(2)155) TaxID=246196 RepID=I7G2Z9_MYCS2|nr:hypothetical protein MSMEI_3414 [Mycolicibacterium smegmatis MC2 155]